MSERGPKRLSTWWLALPAGVALVTSGVVVGRTNVRPATANVRPEADKASSAKSGDRRLALLEREVLMLRAQVAASSPNEATTETQEKTTQGSSAEEEPLDPEEAEHDLEERRAEFLDGLAERVGREPRDARWQSETEPVISKLLPEHLGPGVTVSTVSCASSICSAKVEHPGSPRLSEDRLADFMLQRGPLATMQVNLDTRETGTTTLYFMRGEEE